MFCYDCGKDIYSIPKSGNFDICNAANYCTPFLITLQHKYMPIKHYTFHKYNKATMHSEKKAVLHTIPSENRT